MGDHETQAGIDQLRAGNGRFQERVFANEPKRAELAKGQAPFAAVLGCADSRVAVEILFDTGLGEVFVVRVAGNVANISSIASLEYAVVHLGVRLIVVLGHESCGAVGAAIEGGDSGRHLGHLLDHIAPAVEAQGERDVDAVARRNAVFNARRLMAESAILRDAADKDGLRIATAFFHFTGEVEFEIE